jgi:hydroxymethylglutaryl-CoA lyase
MTPVIRVTEVGPRDGLQNESVPMPLERKIAFVERLADAGCPEVEVTSFVSPKRVPQLSDAAELLAAIRRRSGVVYSALVPNEAGLDRALEARVDKIAVFTAASESFCRRNVNASIAESIARFEPVLRRAKAAGLPVRGYVSCAVACPFEGPIAPRTVAETSRRLRDIGCDEIDLGDTIGVATPRDIERLLEGHAGVIPIADLTLHLHDTRGTALVCAWRGIELGVRSFDASCGGLGGCPFAPGAAGNLATEELVYACEGSGWTTGIEVAALLEAGSIASAALGRPLPSRLAKAGPFVPATAQV